MRSQVASSEAGSWGLCVYVCVCAGGGCMHMHAYMYIHVCIQTSEYE